MPKDKKTKEKEGTSSSKEPEAPKRKSSIVDPSSGGSSSSSSDTSDNSSDHSGSGDSDSSTGFDEKATMTGDSGQGTSNGDTTTTKSRCSVDIRDRTEEMRRLMNENKEKKMVTVVDETNEVPVSDETHMVPIGDREEEGEDDAASSPTTSSSSNSSAEKKMQNGQKPQQQKNRKKGKQAKQLTKKQRKEIEKREQDRHIGIVANLFPGQQNHQKAMRKVPPLPVEMLVGDPENPELHAHHFDEWTGDEVRDGKMIVRGTNAAAQSLLSNQSVQMAYFRSEQNVGPAVQFTDLHRNSQMRFLKYIHTVGTYMEIPANLRSIQRMGFGIAGSGIPDKRTLMLTVAGAKHFMKHDYSDYVATNKLTTWRSEYLTSVDFDGKSPDQSYLEIMDLLKEKFQKKIDASKDDLQKFALLTVRDGDLRNLLCHFGEVERRLIRQEQEHRDIGQGVGHRDRRFDHQDRKLRINYLAKVILEWSTLLEMEVHEDAPPGTIRCCSILTYLSARCKGEKQCHKENHRKCTMLSFMLGRLDDKQAVFRQRFFGGNTLLHMAAMAGAACQVNVLLNHGAALNVLNDQYRSPVALAVRRHTNLIARLMMWHGADIGASLSLESIQPRTTREAHNKEVSLYLDHISRPIQYKARDYITIRVRALNNSFVSWIEALVADAEPRIALGVDSVKSNLHQLRIGQDPFDSVVRIRGTTYIKKTVNMSIERSTEEFSKEPVVLFIIPCQYDSIDTVTPPTTPYIVRVPMFTDATAVAQRVNEKDKRRQERGDLRREQMEELEHMRPIRLFQQTPTFSYGDGAVSRTEALQSFFTGEHNGNLYAYDVPVSVSKSSQKVTPVTLTLHIPQQDAERFQSCHFQIQAVQMCRRGDETTSEEKAWYRDQELQKQKVSDRKAARAAGEERLRQAQLVAIGNDNDRRAEARVRSMVDEVQQGVEQRKRAGPKGPKRKTD